MLKNKTTNDSTGERRGRGRGGGGEAKGVLLDPAIGLEARDHLPADGDGGGGSVLKHEPLQWNRLWRRKINANL